MRLNTCTYAHALAHAHAHARTMSTCVQSLYPYTCSGASRGRWSRCRSTARAWRVTPRCELCSVGGVEGLTPRPLTRSSPLAPRLDLRPNLRQVALEARLDHEERSRLASLRALCPGYFALPGETLDGLTPCSNPPQPEPQTYSNPTLPGPIPNHVGKKLDHLHRRRQRTTDRRGIRFPRTAQGAYNTGY